jgi:hypothetical protein
MLPTLEDRLAIRQLLYRYADAADRRDAAAFAACFAGGAVDISGPGFAMTDAGQVVDTLAAKYVWTMHNVHNNLHEVDGDRASGHTYCVASHVRAAADGARVKEDWYIRYEDELLRQGGDWVFLRRRLEPGAITHVPLAE